MDQKKHKCLDGNFSELALIAEMKDSYIFRCLGCHAYLFNDIGSKEWEVLESDTSGSHERYQTGICEQVIFSSNQTGALHFIDS